MTQQHRFLVALKRLQDWHADSLKARDYNSPGVSSSKPGAVHLRVQRYPSTARVWGDWRFARTDEAREAVIAELEAEYDRLSGRPRVITYRDFYGKTRFRTLEAP